MAITFKDLKTKKTPTIKTNDYMVEKYGVDLEAPLTQKVIDLESEKYKAQQTLVLKVLGKHKDITANDIMEKPEKIINVLSEKDILNMEKINVEFNEQIVGAIKDVNLEDIKEHFANVYQDSDLGSNLYTTFINDLETIIANTVKEFQETLNDNSDNDTGK